MTDAPTLDLVAAIVFGISLVALIVWSCYVELRGWLQR
jgi:hypothetical protein|tara:strand:+ start:920 stop:1033 length:114 start_codon:yes stop_codon:yes gene_type:complete